QRSYFACSSPAPPLTVLHSFFFFYCSGVHRDLHSFPTRRSSDLVAAGADLPEARGHHHPRLHRRALGPALLPAAQARRDRARQLDRKSTRLNSSHVKISYAVFCLKKKNKKKKSTIRLTTIHASGH